jgi:hypothetical protein
VCPGRGKLITWLLVTPVRQLWSARPTLRYRFFMGWMWTILGIAGLLGCAEPCLDLVDVLVEDPDDLATEEEEVEIRAAMDEFASWIGDLDLCVECVRIRWISPLGVGGLWRVSDSTVTLEPHDSDFTRITRHELCHAADYAMGWVSLEHPRLFDFRRVEYSELYTTVDERTVEAFARACEGGPPPTGIDLGLDLACGLSRVPHRTRWLLDHLWVSYEMPLVYRGTFALEQRSVPIHWNHGSLHGMVGAGGRVFALAHHRADARVGERGFDPGVHDKHWWEEPGAELDASVFQLLELDPDRGEVIAALNVNGLLQGAQRGEVLFPGDELPLLVAVGDEETRGWLVDPATGTTRELPLPALESFPMRALVHGERAFLIALPQGETEQVVLEVDLSDGSWELLDLLGEKRVWHWWDEAYMAVAGGQLFVTHSPDGLKTWLARYDLSSGELRGHRLNRASRTTVHGLAPLPDGRLLMGLELHQVGAPKQSRFPLLALYPEWDVWQLESGTCGVMRHEDLGLAAAFGERGLMPWGEGVVFPTEVDGVWSFVHLAPAEL